MIAYATLDYNDEAFNKVVPKGKDRNFSPKTC
jgi:hypothetical protein